MQSNEPQTTKGKYNNLLKYATLGTQMMVLLALGIWGGLKLDEKLNTLPLFLIIFPLLGLVLSFYQLYRQLIKPKK